MKRAMILCLLGSALTGCAWLDKAKPVDTLPLAPALVPQLPVIEIERPALVIHSLTPDERQQPNTLVKAYVASVQQLLFYAQTLEQVIEQLQQINTAPLVEDTPP